MGYFKNTMYYGPIGQDLGDNSPEALAERKSPSPKMNYRVIYRRSITDAHQEHYFSTDQEARTFSRQKRDTGYIGAVQHWNSREQMWIG